jgi:hypothetical protein
MLLLVTLIINKQTGLVDIGQRGLEGNTKLGRDREAYHPWGFFLWPQEPFKQC